MSFAANERPSSGSAARSGAQARAEYPPSGYWRRWCGDASPPTEALTTAPPEAEAAVAPAPKVVPTEQGEPPYRVLIVEDDRSQALFAQGVLRGAGMEAEVVPLASDTMSMLARLQPDLVLMDLHMPGMSGTELTAQIRSDVAYAHIPVVFLTGDTDPESHLEVLDSGADDYLSKPVRPRHLIAAVQNRVRRARALKQQREQEVRRHPTTGLLTRTFMLQQLTQAFPTQTVGAVHFVVIEGTSALRDHYGYAALDAVLSEAGRLIGEVSGERPAARLNDNTFVVYWPGLPPDRHMLWARQLRDTFTGRQLQIGSDTLRLRACVGYVDLAHGFSDAGAALAAAEEALRAARNDPVGIAAYRPPSEAVSEHAANLLSQLQEALKNERLELAFQPIVSVVGGDHEQYQTLVRLRDGSGQLHTAAEIVPLAERAGLVHEIDRRVMSRAIAILGEQPVGGRRARLFVPQSARSLGQEGYAHWLLDSLKKLDIAGDLLVVDVRLSEAQLHSMIVREFCQQMMAAGVRLCLSQFQSNPEADALLSQLPLSYVRLSSHYAHKIDQQAVQDEMKLLIERAHQLGLQVIGQHVEDPQTAATLWLSGIDFIQGDLVQRANQSMDFDFQHSLL
ncbi:EAL domain-containing protein [Lysobacter brunescens]|uniref:EAL domain-containing protein n=1 Tax=Lysobacter brunescens TaxID=262323 RepID=A0ABW2Y857_9GAMM